MARSLARERFGATLLSVLAALALALTAFGIYGVLAYTVQQRRREIGIRMALGADGQQVTRMVMVQGIAPVLVGVLLGVVGSIGLSRVVAGFLWGVTPTDPATLATVAAMLLGVALVASWIPAREAAGLDPAQHAELRIGLPTATPATTAHDIRVPGNLLPAALLVHQTADTKVSGAAGVRIFPPHNTVSRPV